MRIPIINIFIFFCSACGFAQEAKTKNIIIVTLDGYRWHELYKGADPKILYNSKYVQDTSVHRFWDPTEQVRREKLMPFMWSVIAKEGQLYGNRQFKNKVNCTNIHLLSYPGYSEMFVGFPERKVSNNHRNVNPNPTVFEFIHQHKDFKNEVAAFATWDVFPYILREEKHNFYVSAGSKEAKGKISDKEKQLNALQRKAGGRYDELTFGYAMEYLKRERPRVLYLGFDGTDDNAHGGHYDGYLKSAHRIDSMLNKLWNWVQTQPDYKDQTTLFVTTDHGRGHARNNWRNHRLLAPGSGQIWFAAIGPDTPPFGEMKFKSKYYQKQVAKTIAAFLGLTYENRKPVGEVIQTMLAVPEAPLETLTASEEADAVNDKGNNE